MPIHPHGYKKGAKIAPDSECFGCPLTGYNQMYITLKSPVAPSHADLHCSAQAAQSCNVICI